MRRASGTLVVSAVAVSVSALITATPPPNQASAQAEGGIIRLAAAEKKAPAKKAAPNPAKKAAVAPAKKKGVPAPAAAVPAGTYTAMPLAERVGIQFDLAWTGHYNGLINGEFNDRAIAAMRAFQKDYR